MDQHFDPADAGMPPGVSGAAVESVQGFVSAKGSMHNWVARGKLFGHARRVQYSTGGSMPAGDFVGGEAQLVCANETVTLPTADAVVGVLRDTNYVFAPFVALAAAAPGLAVPTRRLLVKCRFTTTAALGAGTTTTLAIPSGTSVPAGTFPLTVQAGEVTEVEMHVRRDTTGAWTADYFASKPFSAAAAGGGGWPGVLAVNNTSGANNPTISLGSRMEFVDHIEIRSQSDGNDIRIGFNNVGDPAANGLVLLGNQLRGTGVSVHVGRSHDFGAVGTGPGQCFCIGELIGGPNITAGAFNNYGIGFRALGDNTSLTSAGGNCFMGQFVMQTVTSGGGNVGIGGQALRNITTAGSNTAVGVTALVNLGTGTNNTAVGSGAGGGLTAAAGTNTCVGQNTTGTGALTFLSQFGQGHSSTASGVVALGTRCSATHANAILIGHQVASAAANSLHFGSAATNVTVAAVANVGGIVPPATVAGYLDVFINGANQKIPFYAP